jgi:hypothetical protein
LAQHETDRLRGADRADCVEAETKVLKSDANQREKTTRESVTRIEWENVAIEDTKVLLFESERTGDKMCKELEPH